ncbi:2-hydroxyacid dehydrogenase [Terricaulis silvestris]|uniref:Glycerate dehydrogenase n=1 Tax=Terricaulis silvestris TaxID=2686094 RepID=A0A6I6MPI5_9CAUL|nr:NAD(P)-dependent oxidoreductase [Terricaulis silvestris]QGZ96619.1 Glycerate dehydrogenase [Terricaulis silvestris]
MTSIKTLVATVPGMIGDEELKPLRELSEVVYREEARLTQEELALACAGADYLMLNYDVVKTLTDGFYAAPAVRALKAISVDITGMEWANPHLARRHGVLLMNTPRYSTESVAESTLAEVLLHSRKLHLGYKDMIAGREPEIRKGINLKGRTAGIVGLGSIGARVAEVLSAIGMRVIAWNRTPLNLTGVTQVSLPDLFARCDVICLCLKTVTEGAQRNVGAISDELLVRAQPGTILINLAGIQLVDHDALYREMLSGRFAGYSVGRNPTTIALDLAKLDSVSMPAENAWFSDESLALLRDIWVGNIVSAIHGAPQNVFVE